MPIGKIEIFETGTHKCDAYCRRVKLRSLHRVAAARAPRRQLRSGGEPAASCALATTALRPCPRCGREGHAVVKYRYKYYSCDKCGEKDHLKVMCRNSECGRGCDYTKKSKGQFFLVDSDSETEEVNFYNLVGDRGDDSYYADLEVEGHYIRFEVDTGCKFLAISKSFYDERFRNFELIKKSIVFNLTQAM